MNLSSDFYMVISNTIYISIVATMLASLLGIPFGFLVGFFNFRGKLLVDLFLKTMLSIPTVLIGLILYMLLSRNGYLGSVNILYTNIAIILGEMLLITPIIASLWLNEVKNTSRDLKRTLLTFGLTYPQIFKELLHEKRYKILAIVATAYGRAISEVGIAIMVGGNIKYETRTITTAIALDTNKGEYTTSIMLGIVLLIISLIINVIMQITTKNIITK